MPEVDFAAFPNANRIGRIAEATAEGKTIACGWVPPDKRTKDQADAAAEAIAAMPAFHIRGRFTLAERRYPLWKARVSVLGGHKGYIWQSVGSCVGAGGDNMLGTLVCLEILLGQPEEYKHRWWPYTWGRSRYHAGITGRGDGSTGAGWAQAIKEDGIFEHDPAGMADLPDFKEKGMWLQLPGSVELDWSAGEKIKPEWVELGRKHLVKTVSMMRSADDCVEALANGYPITQASNFGFSPMVPRPQGDPPVRLVTWNGSWSHQTYIDEVWDHPTLGMIFRWGNNWGLAHGPALADEPESSVYITAKTLDQICRNGEVIAFSAFDGFPARELSFAAF